MDNAPGPPFHVTNVNSIDLNTQNAQYLPPQISAQSGLAGSVSHDFTPGGFAFADSNEMDLTGDRILDHPSPATISSQSRGGSTSQSSYSPGANTLNEHNLPYRASPKPGFNTINGQQNRAGSAVFPSFSPSNSPKPGVNNLNRQAARGGSIAFPSFSPGASTGPEMYSNTFSTTGDMGDESFHQGFMVGNEWEFGAMNTGSGMTPMSDGSWNQMLESVTMGWDADMSKGGNNGQ